MIHTSTRQTQTNACEQLEETESPSFKRYLQQDFCLTHENIQQDSHIKMTPLRDFARIVAHCKFREENCQKMKELVIRFKDILGMIQNQQTFHLEVTGRVAELLRQIVTSNKISDRLENKLIQPYQFILQSSNNSMISKQYSTIESNSVQYNNLAILTNSNANTNANTNVQGYTNSARRSLAIQNPEAAELIRMSKALMQTLQANEQRMIKFKLAEDTYKTLQLDNYAFKDRLAALAKEVPFNKHSFFVVVSDFFRLKLERQIRYTRETFNLQDQNLNVNQQHYTFGKSTNNNNNLAAESLLNDLKVLTQINTIHRKYQKALVLKTAFDISNNYNYEQNGRNYFNPYDILIQVGANLEQYYYLSNKQLRQHPSVQLQVELSVEGFEAKLKELIKNNSYILQRIKGYHDRYHKDQANIQSRKRSKNINKIINSNAQQSSSTQIQSVQTLPNKKKLERLNGAIGFNKALSLAEMGIVNMSAPLIGQFYMRRTSNSLMPKLTANEQEMDLLEKQQQSSQQPHSQISMGTGFEKEKRMLDRFGFLSLLNKSDMSSFKKVQAKNTNDLINLNNQNAANNAINTNTNSSSSPLVGFKRANPQSSFIKAMPLISRPINQLQCSFDNNKFKFIALKPKEMSQSQSAEINSNANIQHFPSPAMNCNQNKQIKSSQVNNNSNNNSNNNANNNANKTNNNQNYNKSQSEMINKQYESITGRLRSPLEQQATSDFLKSFVQSQIMRQQQVTTPRSKGGMSYNFNLHQANNKKQIAHKRMLDLESALFSNMNQSSHAQTMHKIKNQNKQGANQNQFQIFSQCNRETLKNNFYNQNQNINPIQSVQFSLKKATVLEEGDRTIQNSQNKLELFNDQQINSRPFNSNTHAISKKCKTASSFSSMHAFNKI